LHAVGEDSALRNMRNDLLIRLSGLAAILAGGLRTAASFLPSGHSGATLEILYLVIDLLILFGVLGIYGFQSERIGPTGLVGFILAVTGTAIITGPDGKIGAVDMYAAGSLCVGLGLVVLAVGSWTARTLPRWVGILWLVSTAAGILGTAAGLHSLFMISGIAFGLAFIGAGATVWSAAPRG
jgi:hypothetical protein